MRRYELLWIEGSDGNMEHLAEHGVDPDEVEEVLSQSIAPDTSRSSGRPIIFGYTRGGRKLAVVYEKIDDVTLYPITAYDVEE